ncbi:MAG: N-acetyltransferase [Chloroflexi bacterium]|nr:MAG: N-acetyltransferase [Chloroflexota bacterium]
MQTPDVRYEVSPPVSTGELDALFEASWDAHIPRGFAGILARSIAYVCAYRGDALVGFVHAAWDGGVHAFVLDVTVTPEERHRGVGLELVWLLVVACRERGIVWMHVDFEAPLAPFYERAGFRRTAAGIMRLDT